MKQMIVYETFVEDIGSVFYATKDEAMRNARAASTGPFPSDAEVYLNYIRTDLPKRRLHAALLNREQWQEGRDLIERFPSGGKPAAGHAA